MTCNEQLQKTQEIQYADDDDHHVQSRIFRNSGVSKKSWVYVRGLAGRFGQLDSCCPRLIISVNNQLLCQPFIYGT